MWNTFSAKLRKTLAYFWYEQTKECLLCGKSGADAVCSECRLEYFRPELRRCSACGKLLTKDVDIDRCQDCQEGRGPQNLTKVLTLGYYGGEWKNFIHRVKFQSQPYLLLELAEILIPWLIRDLPVADLITYVPLHPNRQAERGFNQAEVLASVISRKLGHKCEQTLGRVRATSPQTALGRAERLHNLRGAFALQPGIDVKEKTIWLVDDVITTGATISECATVLKKNGATHVYAVCLAAGIENKGES
ncbi:MAG: ComF family protein [Peptococcaceae bacterium]|jgi:competence protein ComFC|nr:ComF family protein [Peptococcaceae bacterium]